MDKTTEAALITKALGYTENGGKPDIKNLKAGKSGEAKSIFQYTPDTWKARAKEVTGNADLPLTPTNETAVTTKVVYDELNKGKTPQQIFSMHNAGQGEPDAYSGTFSNGHPSKGKNKYGVQYDVPSYVDKAMKYFSDFSKEGLPQEEAMANEGMAQDSSQGESQPSPIPKTSNIEKIEEKMALASGKKPPATGRYPGLINS